MASFVKINDFVANAVENMDLESDQLKVALSNTAPSSESSNPTADTNGILGNVTQISYSNLSSRNLTTLLQVHLDNQVVFTSLFLRI